MIAYELQVQVLRATWEIDGGAVIEQLYFLSSLAFFSIVIPPVSDLNKIISHSDPDTFFSACLI